MLVFQINKQDMKYIPSTKVNIYSAQMLYLWWIRHAFTSFYNILDCRLEIMEVTYQAAMSCEEYSVSDGETS